MLFAADVQPGRFDFELLSDGQMMELLCQDMTIECGAEFHEIRLDEDHCGWKGVSCAKSESVVSIEWTGWDLPPCLLHLEFIPKNAKVFRATYGKSLGTVDTAKLPKGLRMFELTDNDFDGSVDFTAFPESLAKIDLSHNAFRGSLDLSKLPKRLEALNVRNNKLEGNVSLDALPASLKILDFGENQIRGAFELKKAPNAQFCVFADRNCFSKEAVVCKAMKKTAVHIGGSGVKVVVDEDKKRHAFARNFLKMA